MRKITGFPDWEKYLGVLDRIRQVILREEKENSWTFQFWYSFLIPGKNYILRIVNTIIFMAKGKYTYIFLFSK